LITSGDDKPGKDPNNPNGHSEANCETNVHGFPVIFSHPARLEGEEDDNEDEEDDDEVPDLVENFDEVSKNETATEDAKISEVPADEPEETPKVVTEE